LGTSIDDDVAAALLVEQLDGGRAEHGEGSDPDREQRERQCVYFAAGGHACPRHGQGHGRAWLARAGVHAGADRRHRAVAVAERGRPAAPTHAVQVAQQPGPVVAVLAEARSWPSPGPVRDTAPSRRPA
jgi:hypothetical protein